MNIGASMGVTLSNTESIPGKRIVEFYGVVTGNTVRAKHIGRDIMAGLKNVVGGELKGYTELLQDSREEATDRMIEQARSMGANAETVGNPEELGEAFKRAQASDKTSVIVMKVDPYIGWTEGGHTWWEIGTPHVTDDERVRKAHVDWEASRDKQRKGV